MSSLNPALEKLLASPAHNDGLVRVTGRVMSVARPTPRLARITLTSRQLDEFRPDGYPNVAVRLFVPDSGTEARLSSRIYTVRRFDAAARELDIDVVLHGKGLASTWAAQASVGDEIEFAGPRRHELPRADAAQVVYVGDETSLPAITTMVAALDPSATATVIVEVRDELDEQRLDSPAALDVTWLHRRDLEPGLPTLLLDALERHPWRPGDAAWIGTEFNVGRTLRRHLIDDRGASRDDVTAFPYWRRGDAYSVLDVEAAERYVAAVEAGETVESVDPLGE